MTHLLLGHPLPVYKLFVNNKLKTNYLQRVTHFEKMHYFCIELLTNKKTQTDFI